MVGRRRSGPGRGADIRGAALSGAFAGKRRLVQCGAASGNRGRCPVRGVDRPHRSPRRQSPAIVGLDQGQAPALGGRRRNHQRTWADQHDRPGKSDQSVSARASMKVPRRQLLHLAAGAAALPAASWFASAQVYPSRPITIIVPVPPGGVADPIARILAAHLTVTLGQPVVVENVTGAGGSIGVARAARAAPDGYTVSIGNWLSHVGASAVYPVQYDVLRDFEAVP